MSSRIFSLTSRCAAAISSGFVASMCVKSKRSRSGATSDPAWRTWSPSTCAQRRVQQMRRRVIALARAPLRDIDARRHGIVHGDPPLDDAPAMHDQPLGRRMRIVDGDASAVQHDLARVARLAAALGIERRLDQHDLDVLARLRAVLHTQPAR